MIRASGDRTPELWRRRFHRVLMGGLLLTAACSNGGEAGNASDDGAPATTTAEEDESSVGSATPDQSSDDEAESEAQEEAEEPCVGDPVDAIFVRTNLEMNSIIVPGGFRDQFGTPPLLLNPGLHTTTTIGTELTLTIPECVRIETERPGFLELSDGTSSELFPNNALLIFRMGVLANPVDVMESPFAPPRGVEMDLSAWADALPHVTAIETATTIAGHEARQFELTLNSDDGPTWQCGASTQCVDMFVDNRGRGGLPLFDDRSQTVLLIDQDEDAEVVIVMGSGLDQSDDRWAEMTADIVASIVLGDPAPNPADDFNWEDGVGGPIPAGLIRMPIIGGIEFETDRELFADITSGTTLMSDETSTAFERFPPNVEVVLMATDLNGDPIETVEQAVALFVTNGGEQTGATTVMGEPAVVVEFNGVREGTPVFAHIDLDDEMREMGFWYTQDWVKLYIFDTPRGVLALTAEAESEEGIAAVLPLLDLVAETFKLTES